MKRKRRWLLLPLGLAGVMLAGCSAGDLKEYVSKEGRFRVRMPGLPTEKTEPRGERLVHEVRLEQPDGTYHVAYEDVEDAAGETAEQLDKRLDRSRDGALKMAGGKLRGEKRITLAGRYSGREVTMELPAIEKGSARSEWVRQRFFLVDGRLYQLVAAGEKWWVESGDVDKFFDSFALLP